MIIKVPIEKRGEMDLSGEKCRAKGPQADDKKTCTEGGSCFGTCGLSAYRIKGGNGVMETLKDHCSRPKMVWGGGMLWSGSGTDRLDSNFQEPWLILSLGETVIAKKKDLEEQPEGMTIISEMPVEEGSERRIK